jgi:hypothetical protein
MNSWIPSSISLRLERFTRQFCRIMFQSATTTAFRLRVVSRLRNIHLLRYKLQCIVDVESLKWHWTRSVLVEVPSDTADSIFISFELAP